MQQITVIDMEALVKKLTDLGYDVLKVDCKRPDKDGTPGIIDLSITPNVSRAMKRRNLIPQVE
jgi:hypothetical protein